ncbi:MAG: ATP-dependent DNA helicase DinG [Pseudomonadota bacterium]|nr:ATP-dependent DNA helicase DinG [Pseudomonadota bacterium]
MLSDPVKQEIQTAYRQFLERKGIKPRCGQRLMIAAVANGLAAVAMDADGKRSGGGQVTVIEAGTGTGKTLAYLLGVMPVAKALGKKVVLATATVALQDQVINKDIPEVLRHAGLDFSYALAKGRGRYLCLSKLDRLLTPGQDGGTLSLWEDYPQFAVDKDEAEIYRRMDQAVEQGDWSGDRDSWPEAIADTTWRRVTNDHRGCTGRHCGFYEDCPFYRSRNHLYRADLVVANHDLVLADLAMGGGMVLPAPEDTIYVFDEGHHLPDKALNHFSCATQVRGAQNWLQELGRMLDSLVESSTAEGMAAAVATAVKTLAAELGETLGLLMTTLTPLAEGRPATDHDHARLIHRFEQGVVPESLRQQAGQLLPPSQELLRQLQLVVDWLQEGMEGKRSDIARPDAEAWMPILSAQLARAEAMASVWYRYQTGDAAGSAPVARWLSFTEGAQGLDVELAACPVLASDVLASHLWSRVFAAVVTSATLTALGRFDRFQFRSGVPADSHFSMVPSPFDYAACGRVRVPELACDPTDSEQHVAQLARFLEQCWQRQLGTLVLFSSRKQMAGVLERVSDPLSARVLAQGQQGKAEMVRLHKSRIDAGESSVLFGLASFAEGVDLPGEYCRCVVIARLPFAVPEDPVDATLAEWLQTQGRNSFMEITVPDAALRLKQAVGRLLRSETDVGEIVIFDRRILTRRYGRQLLQSLPPFPLVRE